MLSSRSTSLNSREGRKQFLPKVLLEPAVLHSKERMHISIGSTNAGRTHAYMDVVRNPSAPPVTGKGAYFKPERELLLRPNRTSLREFHSREYSMHEALRRSG